MHRKTPLYKVESWKEWTQISTTLLSSSYLPPACVLPLT